MAAIQTIDVRTVLRIVQSDRADGFVSVATLLAVLFAGVETGLFIGILLGLGLYLKRTSEPHLVVLGRVAGKEHYRNINRPDVIPTPGVLVVRIDENLYFANIAAVESFVEARRSESPGTRFVVLALSSVNLIDSSAMEQLDSLDDSLRRAGVELHLSDVKGPVLKTLQVTTIGKKLGGRRIHRSTHLAVNTLSAMSLSPG